MILYSKGEIKNPQHTPFAIKAILIKKLIWPVCLPDGKVQDAAFKQQLLAEVCLLQGGSEINPPAQTYPWASGEPHSVLTPWIFFLVCGTWSHEDKDF